MDKSYCHKKEWTLGNCYLCVWYDDLYHIERKEQNSIPGGYSKREQRVQRDSNSYTHKRTRNTTLERSSYNSQLVSVIGIFYSLMYSCFDVLDLISC